jgi:hypothetical protein
MHVEAGRDRGVDGVEELAELDGPVPAMALADDLPRATSSAANSEVVPCRA